MDPPSQRKTLVDTGRLWRVDGGTTERSPAVSDSVGTGAASVLRTYRALCVAFAVIYPAFGYLHRLRPRAYDPTWLRLGIVGLVIGLLASTYYSEASRRHFLPSIYALGFVIGTHLLYLLYQNHFAVDYLLGYVLILVAIGLLFLDLRALAGYVVYMLLGSVVAGLNLDLLEVDVRVVAGVTLSFGVASYVALWGRLRMTQQLRASNARLAAEVAERERAQTETDAARRDAEAASLAKSQFLANMSHELRTPLNAVIGFASVVLKNRLGNLTPAELDYLSRIRQNGTHLLGVIDDLLDIARIESGRVDVERTFCQIDDVIRERVEQLRPLINGRPIELHVELPTRVEPIYSDSEKLAKIISNLLRNAIKFTECGQVLVRLTTEQTSGQVQMVEVTDTGIGIAADRIGQIFEPFHQVEAGSKRKFEGTGLGLGISRSLCAMLNIRIEVESEVGRGSTFRLILP